MAVQYIQTGEFSFWDRQSLILPAARSTAHHDTRTMTVVVAPSTATGNERGNWEAGEGATPPAAAAPTPLLEVLPGVPRAPAPPGEPLEPFDLRERRQEYGE